MVAPEAAGSSVSAGLGSLAAMVGIDMAAMSGGDAIYPILYPDIIQSLPFLSSLFDVRVQSLDGSIDTTYYYYKSKLQKKSWVDHIKALPKKAMKGAGFTPSGVEALHSFEVFTVDVSFTKLQPRCAPQSP